MLEERQSEPGSESNIKQRLKNIFMQSMSISSADLDDEDSFFSLGLTSLIHGEVVIQLNKEFGELSSTVLFEYPNFHLLAQHLAEKTASLK